MTKSHTHSSIRFLDRAPRWFDAQGFDPLTGMRLVPSDPFICFADSGDDDTPPPSAKTFTQEDLDRVVKGRLKKSEAENAKLAKKLEGQAKSFEDLSSKFEKLQETYDASNKSDVEKELAKMQRAVAKLESEKETLSHTATEATALAEQAVAGLTKTRLEGTLREALRVGKAHGKGMDQAVSLMLANGAKLDDEGAFRMTIDDVPYDKPAEAAGKWLEKNSHFMEGAGGGSGTPRPGGNGKLLNANQMDEMSTPALIAEGLAQPVK